MVLWEASSQGSFTYWGDLLAVRLPRVSQAGLGYGARTNAPHSGRPTHHSDSPLHGGHCRAENVPE